MECDVPPTEGEFGGLRGAFEVAGVGNIYLQAGQPPGERTRLLSASRRESYVGMTLEPSFGIPFGFAVTDD